MLYSEFNNRYYWDSAAATMLHDIHSLIRPVGLISSYKDPVIAINIWNKEQTYRRIYYLSMVKPEIISEEETGIPLSSEELDELMEILTKNNNAFWKDTIESMNILIESDYSDQLEKYNISDTPPDYRVLSDPSLYHDLAYLSRENYDEDKVENCIDKYISDFDLDLSKFSKDVINGFNRLIGNTKLSKLSLLYLSEFTVHDVPNGSYFIAIYIKDYNNDRIVYYNSIKFRGYNKFIDPIFRLIENTFGFHPIWYTKYESKDHHENIFKYRAKYLEEHGLKSDVDMIYKRGDK